MIGRARGGAEGQHLLLQEREQAILCQHRGRSLEQEALVGASAALRHEHELVGVITLGIDLALRRHVVGGVLDRKSTRLNSSHPSISYAVFCLKKKIIKRSDTCE